MIEWENRKRKAEEEAAEAEAAKKPKKKKKKVVHSLADIEDPELKQAMLAQIEEESKRVELEELERQQQEVELTTDEARVAYKSMLAEKNINAMAPWDMELPKFVADPRYLCGCYLSCELELTLSKWSSSSRTAEHFSTSSAKRRYESNGRRSREFKRRKPM